MEEITKQLKENNQASNENAEEQLSVLQGLSDKLSSYFKKSDRAEKRRRSEAAEDKKEQLSFLENWVISADKRKAKLSSIQHNGGGGQIRGFLQTIGLGGVLGLIGAVSGLMLSVWPAIAAGLIVLFTNVGRGITDDPVIKETSDKIKAIFDGFSGLAIWGTLKSIAFVVDDVAHGLQYNVLKPWVKLLDGIKMFGSKFGFIGRMISKVVVKILGILTPVVSMFGGILKPIAGILKLAGRFSGLLTFFFIAFDGIVGGFKGYQKALAEGKTGMAMAWEVIKGAFMGIVNGFMEPFVWVKDKLVEKFAGTMVGDWAERIWNVVSWPWKMQMKIMTSIGDALKEFFSSFSVKGTVKSSIDSVTSAFDKTMNFFKDLLQNAIYSLVDKFNAFIKKYHLDVVPGIREIKHEDVQLFKSIPPMTSADTTQQNTQEHQARKEDAGVVVVQSNDDYSNTMIANDNKTLNVPLSATNSSHPKMRPAFN